MRRVTLFLIICLLVFCSTALAQTQNPPPESEPEKSLIGVQKARSLADEFVEDLINNRKDKIKMKLDEKFWSQEYKGVDGDKLYGATDFAFQNQGWKPLECKFEHDKARLFFDANRGRKIPSHTFLYICKTTNPNVLKRKVDWVRGIVAIVAENENQPRIRDFFMDEFPVEPNPDKNNAMEVMDY